MSFIATFYGLYFLFLPHCPDSVTSSGDSRPGTPVLFQFEKLSVFHC